MKNLPLLPEKHFHKDILKNPLADFLASIVIILSCLGNIVALDSDILIIFLSILAIITTYNNVA